MAYTPKLWVALSIMLLVLTLRPLVFAEQQVPCYFIFGDTLVDNGNNNGLVTTAKANFPPYGIDFPDGPTGRFTNGRNMADIIAELLGFDNYIPPFASARGEDILNGVNYASGAAGIRDETGQQMGARISMNGQLINHQTTISRLAILLRNVDLTKYYLSKCIYTVVMGNNDYINNYFLPQFYTTSIIYTPEQYAEVLIQQYSQQIRTLYNYGARKVALFTAGELGCIPAEMDMYAKNGSSCVEMINNGVHLFNNRLKLLVECLNVDLSDAKFLYISTSTTSFVDSSTGNEITVVDTPCCRVSSNVGKGECIPCNDRNEYYFWDAFHPTETVIMMAAAKAYAHLSQFFTNEIDIW